MRYDFCHTLKDERLGINVVLDIECEVELSVDLDGGIPTVSVDGVYVEGTNLFGGTGLTRLLATAIADAAENDDALISQAIADQGFYYVGFGGNDPDGYFRRVSA